MLYNCGNQKGVDFALRYKLIGNNDTDNIIKTALNNRGIEDWKSYLNLSSASRDTYHNLDNIEKAIEVFDYHYSNKHPMAILVDNDVDGICSSTIMYKFIKALDSDYDVRMPRSGSCRLHCAADFLPRRS